MNKILTIGVALALLLAVIQLIRKSAECDRHVRQFETLYSQAKHHEQAAARSQHTLDSLSLRIASYRPSPIVRTSIDRLREAGLPDPVENLVEDLQRHREIIPYKGLHGGPMGFYDRPRIRVLSDRWVYAPFDDGHIGGEALLEFTVGPAGAIAWRVLNARRHE